MGIEHHGLGSPDREHAAAHVGERRPADAPSLEITLEIRVANRGGPIAGKPIGHGEDHEPLGIGALESARPVAEAALRGREGRDLARAPIEDTDRRHCLRDFLSVGAHVLDGRGADQAGNAAEALEPAPPLRHRALHERIPRLAGRRRHLHRAAHLARGDAPEVYLHHEAVDAGVRHHHVGPAPEHANGHLTRLGPGHRGHDGGLVGRLDEEACGAAHAHRAAWSEGHVLEGMEGRRHRRRARPAIARGGADRADRGARRRAG